MSTIIKLILLLLCGNIIIAADVFDVSYYDPKIINNIIPISYTIQIITYENDTLFTGNCSVELYIKKKTHFINFYSEDINTNIRNASLTSNLVLKEQSSVFMSDSNTTDWENNKRLIKLYFRQIIEPGNYSFYLEYISKGTDQDYAFFISHIQKHENA